MYISAVLLSFEIGFQYISKKYSASVPREIARVAPVESSSHFFLEYGDKIVLGKCQDFTNSCLNLLRILSRSSSVSSFYDFSCI